MKNSSLHEISKVLAGAVLADIFALVWLASQQMLPAHFLGLQISNDMLLPSVTFELALFIIFVHYGWNIGKIPRVREGAYLLLMGALFAVITVAHLWQILGAGQLEIMDFAVPVWLSWIGAIMTAYLSYMSFVLMGKVNK